MFNRKEEGEDVRKMCKMWFIVECEHISEYSKVRLHLSKVRKIGYQTARALQKRGSAAKLAISAALTAPIAALAIIYAYMKGGTGCMAGNAFLYWWFLWLYIGHWGKSSTARAETTYNRKSNG